MLQLLSSCSRARVLQQEKSPQGEARALQLQSSPQSPELEKACTQQQRTQRSQKQFINLKNSKILWGYGVLGKRGRETDRNNPGWRFSDQKEKNIIGNNQIGDFHILPKCKIYVHHYHHSLREKLMLTKGCRRPVFKRGVRVGPSPWARMLMCTHKGQKLKQPAFKKCQWWKHQIFKSNFDHWQTLRFKTTICLLDGTARDPCRSLGIESRGHGTAVQRGVCSPPTERWHGPFKE